MTRRIGIGLLIATLSALVAAPAVLSSATAQEEKDASPAADTPREVVVVLNTGERIRGMLVKEGPDKLTLRIAKIDTEIPRDQVDRVITQRPAIERFHEMRSIIDDTDIGRRLMLADWCRDHGLLEQALLEVKDVLTYEPQNGNALRLERILNREIELKRERVERTPLEAEEDRRETSRRDQTRARRPRPTEFPLLSDEDVNLYKVFEVSLDDPPRLLIDRGTITRLLNDYSANQLIPTSREGRDAFYRKDPVEILETMFRLRARELYGEVTVRGLPESLRLFRDDVNSTWLVNGCATTRCHGGSEAGRLLLYNRAPTAEKALVTNLLILERFRVGGEDGDPLINYAAPTESPLVQMGLPRDDSGRPHPDVRGWRPVFRNRNDRQYQHTLRWIRSMHRPRPEIPIEYDLPTWAEIAGDDPKSPAPDGPEDSPAGPDR